MKTLKEATSNHTIETNINTASPIGTGYNITEAWDVEPAFPYCKKWVVPDKETDMICVHAEFDFLHAFLVVWLSWAIMRSCFYTHIINQEWLPWLQTSRKNSG